MTERARRPPPGLVLLVASAAALAMVAIAAAGAAPASPTAGGSWFEDLTARAGVARPHHNRKFENPYAEIMAGYTALGAAAAVADYDG
ncbi:MAG TPA: hypothetical protein VIH93_03745, partial [Thermoanaerobaculia bacterium]